MFAIYLLLTVKNKATSTFKMTGYTTYDLDCYGVGDGSEELCVQQTHKKRLK